MDKITFTTIGERLEDLLKNNCITAATLSNELSRQGVNCSAATISDIINGVDKGFNYKYFLGISKYFNVSLDWLLGGLPISSLDEDMQAIGKYTGLDENAIEALHSLKVDSEKYDFYSFVFEFVNNLISCTNENAPKIANAAGLTFFINSQIRDNDFETANSNNKELKILNFELIQAFNKVIENYCDIRTIIDKADRLYNDYCKEKYKSFTGFEIEITEIESDNENE